VSTTSTTKKSLSLLCSGTMKAPRLIDRIEIKIESPRDLALNLWKLRSLSRRRRTEISENGRINATGRTTSSYENVKRYSRRAKKSRSALWTITQSYRSCEKKLGLHRK
jgi:hypothetical protein